MPLQSVKNNKIRTKADAMAITTPGPNNTEIELEVHSSWT